MPGCTRILSIPAFQGPAGCQPYPHCINFSCNLFLPTADLQVREKKTNLGVVMDSSSNTCHIHAGCCFHSPNYCSLWFDSMWSSHIVKWIWFLPAKTSFFSLIFLHSCFSMHFLDVFLIICDYTVHLNGLESSPQAQPKDNVRGVNAVLIWSITMVIPYYF